MNFSWLKSKKGFTLSEMLVVMVIFSLLSVALAGIFVQFFNAEKFAFASQKIASDMRFTLEMMTREIRMGNIDYRVGGFYSGTISEAPYKYLDPDKHLPPSTLALLDNKGNQILFGLAGNDCETTNDCYVFLRRGGNDYRITPDDLAVNKLLFYISPSKDPFTLQANGTYLSNEQARVLIILEEKDQQTGQVVLRMQTAVSSKIYKR